MQAVLSSRNIIGENSALECEGIVAIHSASDRLQVAEELTSRFVATQFEGRSRTIEVHRHNIQRKLGVHSVAELVKLTIRHELAQL